MHAIEMAPFAIIIVLVHGNYYIPRMLIVDSLGKNPIKLLLNIHKANIIC